MNKKILVLAFVSAALFGCSSDNLTSSTTPPPAWDGIPSNVPSTGGSGSGSGGGNQTSSCGSVTGRCCVFYVDLGYIDACLCAESPFSTSDEEAEEECYRLGLEGGLGGGTIQSSCPSGCQG